MKQFRPNNIMNLDSRGMSLVETLVAIGIMAVFMSVFAQSQANQSKQTKILSEKLAMLDLEKLLIGSFSSGATCTYTLSQPTPIAIDLSGLGPTTPIRVPVNRSIPSSILPSGLPGPNVAVIGERISPDPTSPILENIDLVITEGTAGSYRGFWEFRMDEDVMTGRFKPVRVSTTLNLDITVPTAATVLSCMGDEILPTSPVTRTIATSSTAWRWPSAAIYCNADEYLLSGGGTCSSANGWMFIYRSHPVANETGWVVACDTPMNYVATATVYAVCARRN